MCNVFRRGPAPRTLYGFLHPTHITRTANQSKFSQPPLHTGTASIGDRIRLISNIFLPPEFEFRRRPSRRLPWSMRQNRCDPSSSSSAFLSVPRSPATIHLYMICMHKMLPTKCFFCDQLNPDGARFCNECGSPLYLQQAAQDAAIDPAPAGDRHGRAEPSEEGSATTGLFPGLLYSDYAVDQTSNRGAMSLWRKRRSRSLSNGAAWLLDQGQRTEATLSAGFPVKTEPRRGLWMAAGALALTVVAIPGYYIYRQYAVEKGRDELAPAGQGSAQLTAPPEDKPLERAARPTDAAPASETLPGDSTDDLPAKAEATPIAGHAVAPPAVTPKTTERRSKPKATVKQSAGTIAKGARTEMPANSARAVPPTTTRASTRPRLDTPTIGSCTEAVAALGLCTPGPKQGRE